MRRTPSPMRVFLLSLALTVTAQGQVSDPLLAQMEDIAIRSASLPSIELDYSLGMLRQDEAMPDNVAADAGDGWVYSVQPYALIPLQLKGSLSVGGVTADIDLWLDDLLDDFDRLIEISGRFEAWKANQGQKRVGSCLQN